MDLNPQQVADYLRTNPEFFEANALMLANIQLPHPHGGGRAISIGERQVLTLREKNRVLEAKLSELIQFGEENDALSDKIHRFACALIGTADLDSVFAAIDNHMRDTFFVPHALVRLWGADGALAARPEFSPTNAEVREFAAAMKVPYCGQHAVYETNRWFGEAAPHLKSFAMVALRGSASFGVLLLASEDAERFYAEMGTLYLSRIAEMVSAAFQPHLLD
jgi:uncharacterized protein YigA (DUF484 family)